MLAIFEIKNSTRIKPYLKHNIVQTWLNITVFTATEAREGQIEEEGLVKRILHFACWTFSLLVPVRKKYFSELWNNIKNNSVYKRVLNWSEKDLILII